MFELFMSRRDIHVKAITIESAASTSWSDYALAYEHDETRRAKQQRAMQVVEAPLSKRYLYTQYNSTIPGNGEKVNLA
jgi:hypothetical protein